MKPNDNCPVCFRHGEWLTLFCDPEMEADVIGCECCCPPLQDDEKYIETDPKDGKDYLKCPICGEWCDTIYADEKFSWIIAGCEKCISMRDVLEWHREYDGD